MSVTARSAPTARPPSRPTLQATLRDNVPAMLLGAAAAAMTAAVFLALPPQREATSLARFLIQLVPFFLAAEAIARLRLGESLRLRAALVATPIAFLVIFCWFVPKIFFSLDTFETVYVLILQMVPFIILSMTLAFRLGGGPAAMCRRLSTALLLLMLSGLEDLAFLTVNPHTDPAWATIPERWNWASHMEVFLGHYPTKYEAYAFIGVHVALALLVLFLPARYFSRVRPRRPAARHR